MLVSSLQRLLDRFLLELTEVDMRKAYRMSLMISFVQKLKGLEEMNCGFVFPLSLCGKVEICLERNR